MFKAISASAWRRPSIFATAALLCLSLGSCSRGTSHPVKLRVERGALQGQDITTSGFAHQLQCPETGVCPEGVGRLLLRVEDANYEACTVFLVAPDVAATNAHCLGRFTEAQFCAQARLFFRTGRGDATRAVRCTGVPMRGMWSVDMTNNPHDYAFLRLAERLPQRPFIPDTRSGVRDGISYTVWAVEGGGTVSRARLVRHECRAAQGTPVFPWAEDSRSPMQAFLDCPVLPGNSGAPVLDASGRVVAMMYAGTNPEEAAREPFLRGRMMGLAVNFRGLSIR